MKKTIILIGKEQHDQAKRLIEFLPDDGPLHRVIIEPHEETRGSKANAYYWGVVVKAMAGELGQTKDELHYDNKYRFLVPIYIRDRPGYAEMIEAVKAVRRDNPALADTLRRGIVKETSTTTATGKQFVEFVKDVERHCVSLAIKLPARDEL